MSLMLPLNESGLTVVCIFIGGISVKTIISYH